MRHLITYVVAVALLLLASNSKAADPPAKNKGELSVSKLLASYRGHPFFLFMLHNDLVAKDIGLSARQKEDVDGLMKGYARETRDDIRGMNVLMSAVRSDPDGPPRRKLSELCSRLNEKSDRYEALSLRLVDGAQRKRLEQLKLQMRGILVLFDASVSGRLQVTPAQREQIAKEHADCTRKSTEVVRLVTSRKMPGPQGVKEVNAIRRQARERAVLFLTAAQREEFDRILGPKPAFDPTGLTLREALGP